jgi:hypothetical protein
MKNVMFIFIVIISASCNKKEFNNELKNTDTDTLKNIEVSFLSIGNYWIYENDFAGESIFFDSVYVAFDTAINNTIYYKINFSSTKALTPEQTQTDSITTVWWPYKNYYREVNGLVVNYYGAPFYQNLHDFYNKGTYSSHKGGCSVEGKWENESKEYNVPYVLDNNTFITKKTIDGYYCSPDDRRGEYVFYYADGIGIIHANMNFNYGYYTIKKLIRFRIL